MNFDMIYHSTQSDYYLWILVSRGKKKKEKMKHTRKKISTPPIFNGRNKKKRLEVLV